jgi:chromosome segregation ATPase
MARKASVIMSAAERKQAGNDLAVEIKAQKEALKGANNAIKELEKQLKTATKERDSIAKGLTGLETRKAALNPPKPILTQAAVAA